MENTKKVNVRSLECNVCGLGTKGRQWWNRDTGYGLCKDCGEWMLGRGMPLAEVESLNGKRGYNWDVGSNKVSKRK